MACYDADSLTVLPVARQFHEHWRTVTGTATTMIAAPLPHLLLAARRDAVADRPTALRLFPTLFYRQHGGTLFCLLLLLFVKFYR